MKVEVSITQDNIDEGEQGESYSCPIALALCEMGYCDVSVDDLEIIIVHEHPVLYKYWKMYSCSNKRDISNFIDNFDSDIEVEPITFNLEFNEVKL